MTAAIVAVVVAATGCSGGGPDPDRPGPRRAVPCPDEADAAVLAEHSCHEVSVRRGVVIVVQVEPPAPSSADPVVVLGTNLGSTVDYAGLALIAQRTQRTTLLVALRGVPPSMPVLSCPEVTALTPAAAADPTGTRPAVVAAVAECRRRLAADGVDPAAFGVEALADDLHVVTEALSLRRVVALSAGTTGTVAVAWARRHPEDLAALVLDTPLLTNPPLRPHTDRLVARVSAACAAQRPCRTRHGDLRARWRERLSALARRPVQVTTPGGAVLAVDDDTLRRAVVWLAGGARTGMAQLPTLLDETTTAHGGELLTEFAERTLATPPYCVGYLPKCYADQLVYGAMLSANCPVLASDALWRDICLAWGAETAAPPSAAPSPVDVPALVLTGRYDDRATTARIRALLAPVLPGAFWVEDPAVGHNVLGGDCIRTVRSAWLAGDVDRPPVRPPCLRARALSFP